VGKLAILPRTSEASKISEVCNGFKETEIGPVPWGGCDPRCWLLPEAACLVLAIVPPPGRPVAVVVYRTTMEAKVMADSRVRLLVSPARLCYNVSSRGAPS